MTVHLWRIAADTPQWNAADMDGKGAAAKGARWNKPREHVTYTSTSISLAAWETRAHLGKAGARLPFNRCLVRLEVPDDVWKDRASAATPLPVGWNAIPEGMVSRELGSAWLANGRNALLAVPSVVIEEEYNVLINPAHGDAARVVATKVRRFVYDPRV
ncbi:MAG: RES family NAD+ phosphorylase [Proteobacteria bacterium]|nr:RES family NAD+ phosphorylase [Burkholderiales bacterium]